MQLSNVFLLVASTMTLASASNNTTPVDVAERGLFARQIGRPSGVCSCGGNCKMTEKDKSCCGASLLYCCLNDKMTCSCCLGAECGSGGCDYSNIP